MKQFSIAAIAALASFCTLSANAQQTTKYGEQALPITQASGSYNTGIGYYALNQNSTGVKNTAVGGNALRANQTGEYNNAVGYASMFKNISGRHNSAYGLYTLFAHETGDYNVAIGSYSLQANVNGICNVGIGFQSLGKATGSYNIGIGYSSLYNMVGGTNNVSIGNAGQGANEGGSGNVSLGNYALNKNQAGNYNIAIGTDALKNGHGNGHVAVGHQALLAQQAAIINTAIGSYALSHTTTGGSNVAVGSSVLVNNTTGSYNTAIGTYAEVLATNLNNATAIGFGAIVDRSNKVRIGNTNVTSIGGQVGWTTFSDGRFKREIKEDVPGLVFIRKLRPVTYFVKTVDLNNVYIAKLSGNNAQERNDSDEQNKVSADAAGNITYTGFIAQEVDAAATTMNYNFSGVDKPTTKDGLYGLRYDNFIAPLVKAVQELSEQNEALKAEIASIKQLIKTNASTPVKVSLSDAKLSQNTPNPFTSGTQVSYQLPEKYQSASLVITNSNGQMLKSVKLTGKGKNTAFIEGSQLAAGTYQASLVIDGNTAATIQMVHQ